MKTTSDCAEPLLSRRQIPEDAETTTQQIAAAEKALAEFAEYETSLRMQKAFSEACCRAVQERQSFDSLQARLDAISAMSASKFLDSAKDASATQEVPCALYRLHSAFKTATCFLSLCMVQELCLHLPPIIPHNLT